MAKILWVCVLAALFIVTLGNPVELEDIDEESDSGESAYLSDMLREKRQFEHGYGGKRALLAFSKSIVA